MIQHDLKRVRANMEPPYSFHCSVHGVLPDDEARDVLARAGVVGMRMAEVQARMDASLTWRFLGRLLELWAAISPKRCRVVR